MPSVERNADSSDSSITSLLLQLSEGRQDAEAQLIPQVYSELRRLAARYMRRERVNHTLQPTALVHEAYERLVQQPEIPWQSRAQFFAAASNLMRHILVDHARARQAGKRGGIQQQVTLDEAILPGQEQSAQLIDVLALHEAIERLTALDQRQGRIVELHFFGGLTFEEIASVLKCSERTVKGDWSMARAWLKRELAGREAS